MTDMVGQTVTCAVLANSLLIFGAMSASAQTRSFYNERGSFAGQSFTRGNSTSFSDGQRPVLWQRDPARQLDVVL